MPKINVQFHAEPTELVRFIKDCVKEYDLYIVLLENNPDFVAKIVIEAEYSVNIKISDTNRVCLSINEPCITSSNLLEFLDKNPNCLTVTIGRYSDNKLVESVLAAQTDNTSSLKVWKNVVKKLNSITLAGAWVVNPHNGAKVFYKQHRYTERAKKLSEEGVNILPIAGWNYFVLSQ